jgi:starvation-inducible outer membrane lipoprotein
MTNSMKTKTITLAFVALAAVLLQGCISFPPLIEVEHKDSVSTQELMRRLDAIDHRLDQLEQRTEKKP